MNRKEERRQRQADSGAQVPRQDLFWLGFGFWRVGKSFDFIESKKEHEIPYALSSLSPCFAELVRPQDGFPVALALLLGWGTGM